MKKSNIITDSLHGIIQLSNLEKKIINSEVFNRLHYISQNSTAYLTFPSNKTKRFEHSLGTMKLAGDIFLNSICNTDKDTIKDFFDDVKEEINILLNSELKDIQSNHQIISSKLKNIDTIPIEVLVDEIGAKNFPIIIESNQFIYYYLMYQSTRVLALLHDVGHPPFSHVTEYCLEKTYNEISIKEHKTKREKEFTEALDPSKSNISNLKDLHEEIGKNITHQILNLIYRSKLKENEIDIALLYYLIDLITRNIYNKNNKIPVISSVYDFISGTLDADRLDYVSRDLTNSGVKIGKVEYDRIVINYILFKENFKKNENKEEHKIELRESKNYRYHFAPTIKCLSSIENFFIQRNYLYKNVLFHHRVAKTDEILKNSVEYFLKKYLEKEIIIDKEMNSEKDVNNNEKNKKTSLISQNIDGLWEPLKPEFNINDEIDKLIQWNDSFLLTILYKHYFNETEIEKDEMIKLQLEELLSGRKNFFSLVKGSSDFNIIEKAVGIRIKDLEKRIKKEKFSDYQKLKDIINNKESKGIINRSIIMTGLGDKNQITKEEIGKAVNEFLLGTEGIKYCFTVVKKLKTGFDDKTLYIYDKGSLVFYQQISNSVQILQLDYDNFPMFYTYYALKEGYKEIDINKKLVLESIGEYIYNKFINKGLKEYFDIK